MGTNTQLNADAPDTDTRSETKPAGTDRLNAAKTQTSVLVGNITDQDGPPRLFDGDIDGSDADLDDVVAAVTTIAQSWCEHATNYADIETLVCRLPLDQWTFATHDAFAPYSGPYPTAMLIRAFLIKEINGWDDTALHDRLYANPSLRRDLGFESLPDQSTFWRAWNHRCSEALRDAGQDCADVIVRTARACDVSLPDRIDTDKENDSHTDDRPEHQLIAEETDEVW